MKSIITMKNKLSSNEQFQNRKAKIFYGKTGCEKLTAAVRRYSAKKLFWNILQNSQENAHEISCLTGCRPAILSHLKSGTIVFVWYLPDLGTATAQNMKFSIKDFFSKCDHFLHFLCKELFYNTPVNGCLWKTRTEETQITANNGWLSSRICKFRFG